MPTFHCHITGRVQGVGFRPLVHTLAKSEEISGQVSNGRSGVHIHFEATREKAKRFIDRVIAARPEHAVITAYHLEEIEEAKFKGFTIVQSQDRDQFDQKIAPDFATCTSCLSELNDQNNRRYNYPFITCTVCGPRYSIIKNAPYDRQLTSMLAFHQCETCSEEYEDLNDRRYYSQTNSCAVCGVHLTVLKEPTYSQKIVDPIDKSVETLKNGDIVSLKGIGGFLLMCDAANLSAIQTLRDRKQRPDKPFAVLYPNIEWVEDQFELSSYERNALLSPEAPIVLLSPKKKVTIAKEAIAPGLNKIGVMLPYAPLLHLISQKVGRPLIATSGNVSGSPIIHADDKAVETMSLFADLVIGNNREIINPQDDSVVQFAKDQRIILRRSRGLAPAYFGKTNSLSDDQVMAMGAQMKGSLAIANGANWHVSQYLGSLESFDAQQVYQETLAGLIKITGLKPKIVLSDMHPGFFASQKGKEIAREETILQMDIQHHEAHFASVLLENDLVDQESPVLGVMWDGTGLGTDGQIWGGEFFVYQTGEMERTFHLEYKQATKNDLMAKKPRLSALSYATNSDFFTERTQRQFNPTELKIARVQLANGNIRTSSIGRLFDAMASWLGLIQECTFEGQAAMLLEACAAQYHGPKKGYYDFELLEDEISMGLFLNQLKSDLKADKPIEELAFKFHLSLAKLIEKVANELQINKLAFSGGVFQNALLVSLIQEHLSGDFSLYFNKELCPNDENISFGQLAHFFIQRQFFNLNKEHHVFSDTR